MRDAQKRQKAASPPWERIFEADFDALARRTAPLPSELSDLLRLFDGTRTLRAVVDASDGDDGLKRFGALEREKLLAAAITTPHVADEDDEALDAWLAEDAPAASRPWLRWSIAPAALVLAVAVVAVLRPAARPTVGNAASPPAAAVVAANANAATVTSETKSASAAPVAKDAPAATVANAAASEKAAAPAAVVTAAATPVSADKPAAVEPAAVVAPVVTAKAEVAPAAKIDAPRLDAPTKDVTPKFATAAKLDAPPAKVEAPATVLASASAPVKVGVAAPGVGGNGLVEKGGATVAAKTSAPVAAAAPAATGAADPARYAALMAEGKSRYAKGQWKAARTAYLAAMQLDPSRTDALVPLARCQLDSGALDDAFGNARRAIAARGDDADAWLIVGAVEQQRSHAREARTAYQKYLTLAPNAAYASDVRAVLRTLH